MLKNASGRVLYVGKAKSLRSRLASYFTSPEALGPKTRKLVSQVEKISFILAESEFDALLLEAKLIKKYQPYFNATAKDDKHFLYIKITSGEEFPKVTTSRREDESKAIYFGPFPSADTVRSVLRLLRRVFPYCSSLKIGKRPCFYSHIGLCRPCPAEVVKQKDPIMKKRVRDIYRKNIKRIVSLLSGRSRQVLLQLEMEMEKSAKEEKFEDAAKIRDQFNKIKYIITPRVSISDYLENPNLLGERREEEEKELAAYLRGHGLNIKGNLKRIEAFDVSDIRGGLATGSLVVFESGEPKKSDYRRFRLRSKETPDDVAKMGEVIRRRLKHQEWKLPDLIVVDGGKGQVRAALEALRLNKLDVPVIGLAKREEEIYIPVEPGFRLLKLSPQSASLRLIQRLRDEAHRFARAYHLKLRESLLS